MPLNKIEIRTEEIDEILGKTPNSLIRWGISVIFFVVVVLLIGSWFFKYPDFIASSIEITSTDPPVDIIAKASGKIDNIFVADNEAVSVGDILAVIENPAGYNDVSELKSLLGSFHKQYVNIGLLFYDTSLLNRDFKIGELQTYLSVFVSTCKEYRNFSGLAYYPKKIAALERQHKNQQLLYNRTWQQKLTLEKDLELAKKEFDRYEKLFQDKTIPEAEHEKAKSKFLQKQYSFEGAKTNLANIKIQIAQLENSILDLQLQQNQNKKQLLNKLDESYNNLLGRIDIWENNYVLKSPADGICTFTKYWSKNQNVKAGEKVMTVIPNGKPVIIGKLLLPVRGAGKVRPGQKVNVKLQNYPYMEFGMVSGIVGKISPVPNDSYYYVEVQFPSGIKTNYGKELPFSPNMQGSAEIITADIRLLHRILQPLHSIWKHRLEPAQQ